MAQDQLTPVLRDAGMFIIGDPNDPNSRRVKIADTRRGSIYDTIAQPLGAIVAGHEEVFFQNLLNKRAIDTNLASPGRVPAGTELILENVGLYVCSAAGDVLPTPSDIKKLIDGAFLQFRINGILQAEGPAIEFHSGLGFAGNSVENGQGIVSLGTPATGSVRLMDIPQLITKDRDISATLVWHDRIWAGTTAAPGAFTLNAQRMPILTVPTMIRLVLGGQLVVASTK